MIKALAIAATGALLATSSAHAATVTFAAPWTGTQGGGVSDLGSFALSLGGAGSFTVDPGSSGNFFDFTFAGSGTFGTTNNSYSGYYFLRSYSAGDVIGAGTLTTHTSANGDWDTILASNNTAGVWGATHSGYLGFIGDAGHYGYLDYVFERVGSQSTISFFSGAYESVAGASITIPSGVAPVPLPAAGWMLLAGLGGLALTRRRGGAEAQAV